MARNNRTLTPVISAAASIHLLESARRPNSVFLVSKWKTEMSKLNFRKNLNPTGVIGVLIPDATETKN